MNKDLKKKKIEHWKVVTLLLIAYDFLAVAVSYFAALWIRFDCRFSGIEPHYLEAYYHTILIYAGFCVVVFWFMRLYKSIWRFASYTELLRVLLATMVTGTVHVLATGFGMRMPVSYFVFGILILPVFRDAETACREEHTGRGREQDAAIGKLCAYCHENARNGHQRPGADEHTGSKMLILHSLCPP